MTDVAAHARALEDQPRFDILVNNAGGNRPGHFLEVTKTTTTGSWGSTCAPRIFVAQAVRARHGGEGRAGGSIIMMSSQMGHVGAANRTIYCMSKHAIEGLTKAMAVELGPYEASGSTAIGPTFIETPTDAALSSERVRSVPTSLRKIKLGRRRGRSRT